MDNLYTTDKDNIRQINRTEKKVFEVKYYTSSFRSSPIIVRIRIEPVSYTHLLQAPALLYGSSLNRLGYKEDCVIIITLQ